MRPRLANRIFLSLLILACGCGQGQDGGGTVEETGDFDPGPPRELKEYIVDNFDGQTFNPLWTSAGFDEELYRANGVPRFVQFEGRGDVVHYYIPAGTDEVTPVQLAVEGDEGFSRVTGNSSVDEFYVEWSEYFPADHDFARIGQKLLRFTYWREGEERGLELNWAILNDNNRMQLVLHHPHGKENEAELDLGIDTSGIPLDRWVRFGVWARLNAPGSSDGFVRVYMDGQPILTQARMSLRGKDRRGWNVMWLGGNHSNQGPTARASSRYFDDVRWYSTKPPE